MKRMLTLALSLLLVMTVLSFAAVADSPAKLKVGVLTMLNISEDDYVTFIVNRLAANPMLVEGGYVEANDKGDPNVTPVVVYYDTLDAMLMGLNAGDIDAMEVYQSVGDYLTSENDRLTMIGRANKKKSRSPFAEIVMGLLSTNDFSFLMLQSRQELKEEFDKAIVSMKEDGTLDKLVETQINSKVNGEDISPVAIEKIPGADTIKVAITGSLPPFDYVAADGTPAGFNTAVLSEISKRIGKNIELVQVDSIGRATALASGTVDAAFWTRTNQFDIEYQAKNEAEKEKERAEVSATATDIENAFVDRILQKMGVPVSEIDKPEDTIISKSYFSDTIVTVMLKK